MKDHLPFIFAVVVAVFATPPSMRAAAIYLPVNHERVVPLASAEVWRRLHDFLQAQGFAVTSQAREAGVIDASRATAGRSGFAGFAQCGAHLFWRTAQAKIAITIQVKPLDDETRVIVNAAFLELGRPGRKGTPSLPCASNGVLEAAVLNVASGQPMESAIVPQ